MVKPPLLERMQSLRPTSRPDPLPVEPVENEDHRFAQRRAEIDHGRKKKWVTLTIGILTTLLIPLVAYGIMSSPFLDINKFEVIGIGGLDPSAIIEASGLETGDPLWQIDEDEAGLNASEVSWISRAVVTRRWPSTVEIRVTPVEIAAVVRAPGGQTTSVSVGGTAVIHDPGEIDGVLIVDGPDDMANLEEGQRLQRRYSKSLDAIAAMPDVIEKQVEAIQLDNEGKLTLELAGERTVFFGSGDSATYKYEQVSTFIGGRIYEDGTCAIDVEVPSAPSLRRYPDCG